MACSSSVSVYEALGSFGSQRITFWQSPNVPDAGILIVFGTWNGSGSGVGNMLVVKKGDVKRNWNAATSQSLFVDIDATSLPPKINRTGACIPSNANLNIQSYRGEGRGFFQWGSQTCCNNGVTDGGNDPGDGFAPILVNMNGHDTEPLLTNTNYYALAVSSNNAWNGKSFDWKKVAARSKFMNLQTGKFNFMKIVEMGNYAKVNPVVVGKLYNVILGNAFLRENSANHSIGQDISKPMLAVKIHAFSGGTQGNCPPGAEIKVTGTYTYAKFDEAQAAGFPVSGGATLCCAPTAERYWRQQQSDPQSRIDSTDNKFKWSFVAFILLLTLVVAWAIMHNRNKM